MKVSRRFKRIFSFYNIAIFLCVVVTIISICIFFIPTKKKVVINGVEIVQSKVKENEIVDESYARKLAVKQFKNVGEKGLKEADLRVLKIQRSGEEYYYVSSKENTLEIKVVGGAITRVNSELVNK